MIRFEDLLEKVRAYNPDADLELLRRAYVFSAYEHKGSRSPTSWPTSSSTWWPSLRASSTTSSKTP